METPDSSLLQLRRHHLSRPFGKTISPRFNMLTQSSEYRFLVRIALQGLRQNKCGIKNRVGNAKPGSTGYIQCPQLAGLSACQTPAQNSCRGAWGAGGGSGDLRKPVISCTPLSTSKKANRKQPPLPPIRSHNPSCF